ncbi:MAG: MBL fold metallo-hydrolase, partial [Bacillota bacterium]|nr:MBL fold metallo-hydrolase [Bacillota bacterium]
MISIKQFNTEKLDHNSYLIIEGNRAIVVDPNESMEIDRTIDEMLLQVDYILLTHEHVDHICGLERIREKTGGKVVANRICSKNIQHVATNLSNITDMLAYFKTGTVSEERSPTFTCREAEIVFDSSYELEWQNHKFRFQFVPGHSPGSVLIWLDEKSIFSGDYLLEGEEEPLLRLRGGSAEDYETYSRSIIEGVPTGVRIYPGHGNI